MSWGQRTKVYTHHNNLIQEFLNLTSDYIYWWRLILEDCGPKVMHIKDILNNVADAISQLDFGPVMDNKANWMMFMKCWCQYTMHITSAEHMYDHQEDMNMMFANQSKEDVIYY